MALQYNHVTQQKGCKNLKLHFFLLGGELWLENPMEKLGYSI